MANLLVLIELVGDRIHPGSLEALGQARRIGSTLGATVFALIPCPVTPGYGEDDHIAVLSRGGADKVLLASSEIFAQSARWATHGPLLLSVCRQFPPALVLIAETEAGIDLGARAAAHLGAALLCDAWVDCDAEGLVLFGGSGERALRLGAEIDFQVVALVPPGRYFPAPGDEEAEVEVLTAPSIATGEFEEIGAEPDGAAALSGAAVILGEQSAAGALAASLGAVAKYARTAIAILPGESIAREPAWRRALTRIALGTDAANFPTANYAVTGEGAALATELALAITEQRNRKESVV